MLLRFNKKCPITARDGRNWTKTRHFTLQFSERKGGEPATVGFSTVNYLPLNISNSFVQMLYKEFYMEDDGKRDLSWASLCKLTAQDR